MPTISGHLRERLAALSASKSPTPLWVVLYIYAKATNTHGLGYWDGAELIDYLGPVVFPDVPAAYTSTKLAATMLNLVANHTVNNLANRIIKLPPGAQSYRTADCKIAIAYCLIHEVLPRLEVEYTTQLKERRGKSNE